MFRSLHGVVVLLFLFLLFLFYPQVLLLEYGQSVNEVEYVALVCQAINQVYTLIRAGKTNQGCYRNIWLQ